MKKSLILVLALICILTLVACNQVEEVEVKDVGLYPAYILEGNKQLWGYIDKKGEFIVEPKYDTANDYFQGLALVEKDGYFGMLDSDGREILKTEFTNINKVENGYMTAFKDKEVKIFDCLGGEVKLKNKYRNIGVFSDDLFNVLIMDEEENLKFGYIDKTGEEVLAPKYSLAYPFNLGRAIVKDRDKYMVIDKKGKVFKTLEYEDIKPSKQPGKYIYSSTGENFGLLNKDGEVIISDKYSAIVDIKGDLVVVGQLNEEGECFGLFDTSGKQIIESKYNDIKLLGEGYIGVSEEVGLAGENIYTILNSKFEEISEDRFYNIGGRRGNIENGIISVVTEIETYGIDLDGKVVDEIPITSGFGEVYSDGNIVRTIVDGEILYYNMKDEIIWEADERYIIDEDREIVSKNYRMEDGINIKYPHFIGFSDRDIQEEINNRIVQEFTLDKTTEEKITSEKYKYFKTNYNISQVGNIIEIDRSEKILGKNEIEENISKKIYNVDLETGEFYVLEDIFKEKSDFVKEVNHIINEKLLSETDNIGIKKIVAVRADQDFKIEGDKLFLYLRYDDSQDILKGYEEIGLELKSLEEILNYESDFFINRGK